MKPPPVEQRNAKLTLDAQSTLGLSALDGDHGHLQHGHDFLLAAFRDKAIRGSRGHGGGRCNPNSASACGRSFMA